MRAPAPIIQEIGPSPIVACRKIFDPPCADRRQGIRSLETDEELVISAMAKTTKPRTAKPGTAWRHANIGRLLNNAVRRFEARVLELMSEQGHAETRISHVNLTRNLDVDGTRLTELARRACMSKQAMGELVDQCVELGLVVRTDDPGDRRARLVVFTPVGLAWLEAFRAAVDLAEAEMGAELGSETMQLLVAGLAAYGAEFDTLEA